MENKLNTINVNQCECNKKQPLKLKEFNSFWPQGK